MKKALAYIAAGVALASIGCCSTKVSETRDLDYENYCDSIYYNDYVYYIDVLVETDEYQNYIELNGRWWE